MCLAVLLLGLIGAADQTRPASTGLHVRTSPPAAAVQLDGKPLGTSDGLFQVAPGVGNVLVELDGYLPQERRIEIQHGVITRVEFRLKKRSETGTAMSQPTDASVPAGSNHDRESPEDSSRPTTTRTAPSFILNPPTKPDAATALFIDRLELAAPLQEAAATVLRQHAEGTRWSGRADTTLFAMATERLPTGRFRAVSLPALLKLSTAAAVNELMQAKSLLARYEDQGLSDATALRKAVVQVAGRLDVVGSVDELTHQAGVQGDYAVAFVSAREDAVVAYLFRPAALAVVQAAYRDVMHQQARQLMQEEKWQDALGFWRHLHQRKLVSPMLYVDAARCFKALGQEEEVVRLVDEALAAFQTEEDWTFFERAGELVLDVDGEAAQALAERAYTAAGRTFRLRNPSADEPASTQGVK